jgi:predicted DNA-binding protein (UPF0251 family)/predicted Fe-Mo cluster-binding NifX family protein
MPREKNQRTLNFKPIIKEYIPSNGEFSGMITLLHEEIEAIYLMDVLGLYQEDAAKSMEVSRPTFTRILKSARQKLATGLVSGSKIIIEDSKIEKYIVAFCGNKTTDLIVTSLSAKFIFIYKITPTKQTLIETIDNPLYTQKVKPAIVLPNLLLDYKVNIFISSKIGEGFKNTLNAKGIKPLQKNSIELTNIYNQLL